jgi:hypothetical protein
VAREKPQQPYARLESGNTTFHVTFPALDIEPAISHLLSRDIAQNRCTFSMRIMPAVIRPEGVKIGLKTALLKTVCLLLI